jgi:hypothetical protein
MPATRKTPQGSMAVDPKLYGRIGALWDSSSDYCATQLKYIVTTPLKQHPGIYYTKCTSVAILRNVCGDETTCTAPGLHEHGPPKCSAAMPLLRQLIVGEQGLHRYCT